MYNLIKFKVYKENTMLVSTLYSFQIIIIHFTVGCISSGSSTGLSQEEKMSKDAVKLTFDDFFTPRGNKTFVTIC